MADFNWGYRTGRKQAHEAAGGGKIAVRSHTRSPVLKAAVNRSVTPNGVPKKMSSGGTVKTKGC